MLFKPSPIEIDNFILFLNTLHTTFIHWLSVVRRFTELFQNQEFYILTFNPDFEEY